MECAICFEEKENKHVILSCKHSVCSECYKKICVCPFCRKEIKDSIIILLYKRLENYYYSYMFS